VHIVLAGSLRLEEMLASPRMESLAQRIAVRGYLEPLDHAETMAYLRTQTKAAGLVWEKLFAPGCDDAVFKATDGVPRLVNQVCDQSLVLVAESNRRVTPADIAAAWREIQRLPTPSGIEPPAAFAPSGDADTAALDHGDGSPLAMEVMEFGADDTFEPFAPAPPVRPDHEDGQGDPWSGPDVELVGNAAVDPFADFFPDGERLVTDGPDTFADRPRVTSREGKAMGRLLATLANIEAAAPQALTPEPAPPARRGREAVAQPPASDIAIDEHGAIDEDDADMVVIEDDLADAPGDRQSIFSVRPGDYRSLFTRLRRGDRR
jgi:hypothetical protein